MSYCLYDVDRENRIATITFNRPEKLHALLPMDDLEEVREIAERGEMKLWLCDYHLESARLARSEKDEERMAEHYGQAKWLIEGCGCHRWDGELESVGGMLKK